ncbi:Phospholipase A-2-activating protein [Fasciola gigantica]|uniref:Phospholipase A-2-activating protein n=1 Tax=Fasciola gigantica TaxID=46835 RepID=A0A504Y6V4_FASGI|nr:Phospholipase A-2-activating protein [Fasciola gigantica]
MALYKFRCALMGHKSDVRVVSHYSKTTIISGSRDFTVRTWQLSEEGSDYTLGDLLKGHTNYVTALAVYKPEDPIDHLIYTGSNDKLIRAFAVGQENAKFVLKGHEDTVCGLCVDPFGTVISVSWDKTAKIWKNGTCLLTIKGHEAAVWCVLYVFGFELECQIVTGSADHSIRLWKVNTPSDQTEPSYCFLRSFIGHADCVRSLATLDGSRFLSASNDASIRAWDLKTGLCVGEFYGHTNFVYAVATQVNVSVFVSSGEDRCVRVWPIPSEHEWTENKQFAALQCIPVPCKREGQVIVIRQDGRTVCYQWSMNETRWLEIGDVVGSQNPNKAMFEGKEYDFVFTVDIAEHIPPIKLPYNRTEDPWFVAQAFLQRNDLPADYLETVANFIIRNAGPQVSPPAVAQTDWVDPYTGSSRYIPDGGSQTQVSPATQESLEVYFPSDTFISLKNISLDPLLGKLESFISQLPSSPIGLLTEARQFSFNMSESAALQLTETLLAAISQWPIDKIFPLLDLLRCLVFWRQACRLILSPYHWSRIVETSLTHVDMPPANVLLVLRIMANVLAADGPAYLDSPDTYDSDALVVVVNLASTVGQIPQNKKIDISARKPHQVAFATMIHNLTVLGYRSSGRNAVYTHVPRLISLPGLCMRTALQVLSLAPVHGISGVNSFHPDAIFTLLLSVGTALFTLVRSESDSSTDEMLKTRRVLFVASAATGTLLQDVDVKSMGEVESELLAWERAQKILKYWSDTPTALPKVRSCAASLLRLLE